LPPPSLELPSAANHYPYRIVMWQPADVVVNAEDFVEYALNPVETPVI